MRIPGSLLMLLSLLALVACSPRGASTLEHSRADTALAATKSGLPSPVELAKLLPAASRSASYLQADLQRSGMNFDDTLIRSNVSIEGNSLRFDPPGGLLPEVLENCAYCGYSFNVGDYAGAAELWFSFSEGTPELDDFFCLANWDTGRWDCFALNASQPQQLGSIAPYIDDSGRLVLFVMVYGDSTLLEDIRLGSLLPTAQLSASPPLISLPPQSPVDFDAAGSSDPDGTITEYRWDPEGDGSFDVSSGTDPSYSSDLPIGTYNPAVRVYDDSGAYGEASVELTLGDGGILSCGIADYTMACSAAVALADGAVLIFGEIDISSFGFLRAMELKIRPDGSLGQAVVMDLGTRYVDAVSGTDGTFYALGNNLITDLCFVQQISAEGSVNWTRNFSLAAGDAVLAKTLAFDGGKIYVAGLHSDMGGNAGSFMMCLDSDGAVQWANTIPDIEFNDVQAQAPFQLNDPAVYCCGLGGGQSYFCSFTQLGVLKSSKSNELDDVNALLLEGAGPTVYLLQPATVSLNNQPGFRLSKLNGDYCTYTLPLTVSSSPLGMMNYSAGKIALLALQQVTPQFELPESQVLALVNTDFSIAGPAARLNSPNLTNNRGGNLFRYDSTHIGVCGATRNSLPEEEQFDLAVETGTSAWSDVVLVPSDLSITEADFDPQPAQMGGEEFNREVTTADDHDALLWLTPR